jgi:microcystin-dependent protein
MSDTPYVGEIAMVGFNFAPVGWFLCNGQTLPISAYQALFAVIGTTYGGNGIQTFALPDLRGRVPIDQGQGSGLSEYPIGQRAGTENATLVTGNLPSHTHPLMGNTKTGDESVPGPSVVLGPSPTGNLYSKSAPDTAFAVTSIGLTGSGAPFSILPPYLTINFIIAFHGVFPSRG